MVEDQDERVHVRVDVAEHAHDAWMIEPHGLRVARAVAPQIEALTLREREHVVVGAIVVREVDGRPDRDGEQVRHERLVALIHPRACGFAVLERALRRGLEVHDRAPPLAGVALGALAELGRHGPPLARHLDAGQLDPSSHDGAARAARRPRASEEQRRPVATASARRLRTTASPGRPAASPTSHHRAYACCTAPCARRMTCRIADHATPASMRLTGASHGSVRYVPL